MSRYLLENTYPKVARHTTIHLSSSLNNSTKDLVRSACWIYICYFTFCFLFHVYLFLPYLFSFAVHEYFLMHFNFLNFFTVYFLYLFILYIFFTVYFMEAQITLVKITFISTFKGIKHLKSYLFVVIFNQIKRPSLV